MTTSVSSCHYVRLRQKRLRSFSSSEQTDVYPILSRPVHQGSTVTNLYITLGPCCAKGVFFQPFMEKNNIKNTCQSMKKNVAWHPQVQFIDWDVSTWHHPFHFMIPVGMAISTASERHSTTGGTGVTGVVSVEVSSLPAVVTATSASFEKNTHLIPSLHILHLSLHIFSPFPIPST